MPSRLTSVFPRRLLPSAVLGVLPWLWFAFRDQLGTTTNVAAILLPLLGTLLVLVVGTVAVVRRVQAALIFSVSTLIMMTVAVVGPWTPADRGAVAAESGIRLLAANVADNGDSAPDILAQSADVVVVLEMTNDLVTPLSEAYPFRFFDDRNPDFGIYSRLPARVTETRSQDFPGARVELVGPDGPVVLYALHVPRPWLDADGPYQVRVDEHTRLVETVGRRAATETQPVVIVGDLNTSDRTSDYRQLIERGGLVDVMLDGWGAPTSVGKWTALLLRIDHLLVREGWCGDEARLVALPGSDHRAVAATVGPCVPDRPA